MCRRVGSPDNWVVMYSGPWNLETRWGRPQKFDPRTRPDPKKQNPNQPRRQPILNFTLKIPETPKTRGGRPRNVDPRTRPDPEKQTPNPTRPRLLLPDYITTWAASSGEAASNIALIGLTDWTKVTWCPREGNFSLWEIRTDTFVALWAKEVQKVTGFLAS